MVNNGETEVISGEEEKAIKTIKTLMIVGPPQQLYGTSGSG